MSKFSKLSVSQRSSVNIFFGWVRESEPKLPASQKQSLAFLKDQKRIPDIHARIHAKPDWKPATKSVHLVNLGVILRDVLNQPGGVADQMIKEAVNYRESLKEKEKNEDDAGLGKSKDFVPFAQILKRMKELEEKLSKNPKDRKLAMAVLIMQLNTLTPPLRRTLPTMLIIKDIKQNNNINNYLWMKNDSEFFFIINHDKVANKKLDDKYKFIPVNPPAVKAIKENLKLFPRNDYLITQALNGKQCSDQTYENTYLRKTIFPDLDFRFGQNQFRRAYITNILASNPSVKTIEKLALQMRSSPQVMREVYNFRGVQKATINPEDPKEIIEPTIIEHPMIIQELKEKKATFDLKAWSAKYRAKKKEEIEKYYSEYYQKNREAILRAKVLYNLNSGNVKNPTETTLRLYKIKYDKTNKRWV